MTALSKKHQTAQAAMAAGSHGSPLGRLWFVDSARGSNGNHGANRIHPFATLAHALTKAEAGDTILCEPGGSETVTTSLAVAAAGLKISCPAGSPQQGYELTGAGTVDLLTVSASDCHLEGLRFTRTAAAGSTTAGILTTAAADRLTVERCSFDYTALTSAWTNYGIEVTNACNDLWVKGCLFLDCHQGVRFVVATGITCLRPVIEDCHFFVGQSTAFGVQSALTGTGAIQGLRVSRCTFLEADGDGSAATDAWDGTDGTDATTGPFLLEAAVDQYLIEDCRAYSALAATSFENLQAINAGAAGDLVGCTTAGGVGDTVSIYSDTTVIASDLVLVYSDTTAIHSDTTIIASDVVLVYSDTAAIHSDTAEIYSDTTVIASDLVLVYSDTAAIHSDTTVIASDVVLVYSDTAAIHSDTTIIASDVVLLQSQTPVTVSKNLGFAALTTGLSPVTAFTVTGDVLLHAWCGVVGTGMTSTAGTGTLEVGTANQTAFLIAQTTVDGANLNTAGDVWVDATPLDDIDVAQRSGAPVAIGGGSNVIVTVATNDMTAGDVTLYLTYTPLSAGASIVAA